MKKLLFVLSILVLLAAGCNASQQTNNSNPVSQNTATTPTPATTAPVASPTQADTSTWQTYASKQYGFQFQYPVNWTVNDASYTYQGKNDLFVTISSPSISDVPGASRDAYFYTSISNSNGTWQHKEGMNLSLLQSDGGAVPVNVSQQYLESRPEYSIAQAIFASIKIIQQSTNSNIIQNNITIPPSLNSSQAPIPTAYYQGATNIDTNTPFTPIAPSYIPSGYILNGKVANLDGMYQYTLNSVDNSEKAAFGVTEALISTPTTIQSPLFPWGYGNVPTVIDFVNINGNTGYIAINKASSYQWPVLVLVKGKMVLEIDAYQDATNNILIQIAQSVALP